MPRFDIDGLGRTIQEFQCDATSLVPTMMARMLNHPGLEKYDLSSIKRWGNAAAPLPREIKRRFEERFPGIVIEAYGLTETSPTVSMNRMNERREGSLGRPIEGVRVSIQDENGRALPMGETGEICVKGRNVMQGHYNRPEVDRWVIRDGWLHTGDVGRLDEDGFLHVTDRLKDPIIRGGENVYPNDVEEALVKCPGVLEAAVIGMPDADFEEEVMAVIVPSPGRALDAGELSNFSAGAWASSRSPNG